MMISPRGHRTLITAWAYSTTVELLSINTTGTVILFDSNIH